MYNNLTQIHQYKDRLMGFFIALAIKSKGSKQFPNNYDHAITDKGLWINTLKCLLNYYLYIIKIIIRSITKLVLSTFVNLSFKYLSL